MPATGPQRPFAGAVYFTNLGLLLLVAGVWFIRLVAGIVPEAKEK